jgi:hypothetical protein
MSTLNLISSSGYSKVALTGDCYFFGGNPISEVLPAGHKHIKTDKGCVYDKSKWQNQYRILSELKNTEIWPISEFDAHAPNICEYFITKLVYLDELLDSLVARNIIIHIPNFINSLPYYLKDGEFCNQGAYSCWDSVLYFLTCLEKYKGKVKIKVYFHTYDYIKFISYSLITSSVRSLWAIKTTIGNFFLRNEVFSIDDQDLIVIRSKQHDLLLFLKEDNPSIKIKNLRSNLSSMIKGPYFELRRCKTTYKMNRRNSFGLLLSFIAFFSATIFNFLKSLIRMPLFKVRSFTHTNKIHLQSSAKSHSAFFENILISRIMRSNKKNQSQSVVYHAEIISPQVEMLSLAAKKNKMSTVSVHLVDMKFSLSCLLAAQKNKVITRYHDWSNEYYKLCSDLNLCGKDVFANGELIESFYTRKISSYDRNFKLELEAMMGAPIEKSLLYLPTSDESSCIGDIMILYSYVRKYGLSLVVKLHPQQKKSQIEKMLRQELDLKKKIFLIDGTRDILNFISLPFSTCFSSPSSSIAELANSKIDNIAILALNKEYQEMLNCFDCIAETNFSVLVSRDDLDSFFSQAGYVKW